MFFSVFQIQLLIAPGRNGESGQHALMSVGFLKCFAQRKRMNINVEAVSALALEERKKIATGIHR